MSQDRNTDDRFAETGDAMLDALFAETRAETPDPLPDGLRLRVLEDAGSQMPRAEPAPGPGWLSRLRTALSELGGAPGVAGLGAAGLAGIWIGFSGPGLTGDLVSQFWQGAASVSPTVSALVDTDLLVDDNADLLSLMTGQVQ